MSLPLFFRGLTATLQIGRLGLDDTVLAIGTALLLYGSRQDGSGWAWTKPLAWMGRSSYEIYLVHSFFTVLGFQWYRAMHATPDSAPLWDIGITVISIVAGWAVAKWFSEPWNRRLRRGVSLRSSTGQAEALSYFGRS